MISTRRMVAAVGLAVGVTGFAAPMASAAEAPAAGKLNPITQLDALAASGIPAEHQADIPRVADQLAGLNRLNDLNQLHQVTDLVAPVTGLLPGLQA
ncbi:hypothetical protein [Streptomyces sp. NBC_01483]|uniref:hypothetical protein n=1 Tax=Streptomyces sp. NBC_01483 TaxID=2903883 RepID=UPI002E3634E6|nr:hypothetical protein [Streptomyces sp. NBC_01483]